MTIPVDDLVLPATGRICRPLPFAFDFPMQEGFDFLTDLFAGDNGDEQRVAVRDPARPRTRATLAIATFEANESATLEALLYGWTRYTYGVPLWWHAMQLTAATTVGGTTCTVDDATTRDLETRLARLDDVPVLLWSAFDDWEWALVKSLSGNTLTFVGPLARIWPVGTRVLPLLPMALADVVAFDRPTRAQCTATLEFVQAGQPIDTNARCPSSDTDPVAENIPVLKVQLVRGSGAGRVTVSIGARLAGDVANAPAGTPQSPAAADLQGYTKAVAVGGLYDPGKPGMYPPLAGRLTGFSKCTAKAPEEFFSPILGLSIGTVVGTDATLSVYGDYPAGMDPVGDYAVSGSTFSGTGYGPSAPHTPATERAWVVMIASLYGGIGIARPTTDGDEISSYGRYEVGAPGGVHSYTVLSNVMEANGHYVRLHHGFAVRCLGISGFKGIKITVEEVLRDGGGHETGLFGTAGVTTHDFTTDDYTAGGPTESSPGAFVVAECGGTTLFGQAHGQMGGSGAEGYDHATDLELFRVTVALYDVALVETQLWQDIFPTMLVRAELV